MNGRKLVILLLILGAPAFARVRLSSFCQQGGAQIVTSGQRSSTKAQQSFPGATVNVYYTGGATGYATSSGTTLTWTSGIPFNANSGWVGLTITYNGNPYVIASVASINSLTTVATIGTNATPLAWSMPATAPAAIYSDDTGTPKANPYTCDSTNAQQFIYADEGFIATYDFRFSGTGIASPFTLSAQSGVDPFAVPQVLSSRAYQIEGLNFYQACSDVVKRGLTLAIDAPWYGVATSATCAASLQGQQGGLIRPSGGQTVTLNGTFQSGRYRVFDTSLGGAGSIQFAATAIDRGYPEWFGSSVVANTCAVDTLYAGWTAMQAALPVVGTGPTINQGEVSLANTGVGTNAYCIGTPLQIIPRVTMRGGGTNATEIAAQANMAASTQAFMLTTLQATTPCNDNFNTVIEGVLFAANSNSGNQYLGGIQWCPSLGSHLRNVGINTSNVAISWGGPPTNAGSAGNSDGNTSDSITCTLNIVSAMVPYPQCIVFDPGGTDVNTTIISNVKCKGVGSVAVDPPTTIAPCVDVGYGDSTVIMHGINCETHQWCLSIPATTIGMDVTGVSAGAGVYGGLCPTLADFPWAVTVSPSAQSWHVSGYNQCFQAGVVFADLPNDAIGRGAGGGQTLVDPAGHIQTVTTPGTNGTTLETAWNDTSMGTTAWGTTVYTESGTIGPCSIYVATNCQATPGATGTSDLGVYGFDCNPERCISYNKDIPAINQTTYYQPINISTILGNHFTSVSGTPALGITGSGCVIGDSFVRDGGGAIDVGAGTCELTITFSASAGYSHAIFSLAGTAGQTMGAQDAAHLVVNTVQAGIVYYTVMDTK